MYNELETEHITREGEPLKAIRYPHDAQRHMGTMEDNVSPVMPLTLGSTNTDEDGHDEGHSHNDLTPG